jgi:hypothetical protein
MKELEVMQLATRTARRILNLPEFPKIPELDILLYMFLIYGREKIGKTTLLSSWPGALFFSTEPGTKGLSIRELAMFNWWDILDGVQLLEETPITDANRVIMFDTGDRAYDFALTHVCDRLGIPYPGEDDEGKADFGKSWRAVRQEFLSVIERILNTGRGICFTSHAREGEISTRSGQKYTRIYPSMSKQAREVIEALVDVFFYADYMRSLDGETVRVLVCEGDETVWAGYRQCAGKFPRLLPLVEPNGFDVIHQAFRGEHPGIDPRSLATTRETSASAAKLITRMKQADAAGGREVRPTPVTADLVPERTLQPQPLPTKIASLSTEGKKTPPPRRQN